jgi:hypothetical protein
VVQVEPSAVHGRAHLLLALQMPEQQSVPVVQPWSVPAQIVPHAFVPGLQ